MAQAPEVPRPAQEAFAEVSPRDPTEVALSAIAAALEVSPEPAVEAAARSSLLERLARVGIENSDTRVARSVAPELARVAQVAADVGRADVAMASEDEALNDLKEALKSSISARLGSPEDHLASIRNQLRSVLLHVQSR